MLLALKNCFYLFMLSAPTVVLVSLYNILYIFVPGCLVLLQTRCNEQEALETQLNAASISCVQELNFFFFWNVSFWQSDANVGQACSLERVSCSSSVQQVALHTRLKNKTKQTPATTVLSGRGLLHSRHFRSLKRLEALCCWQTSSLHKDLSLSGFWHQAQRQQLLWFISISIKCSVNTDAPEITTQCGNMAESSATHAAFSLAASSSYIMT